MSNGDRTQATHVQYPIETSGVQCLADLPRGVIELDFHAPLTDVSQDTQNPTRNGCHLRQVDSQDLTASLIENPQKAPHTVSGVRSGSEFLALEPEDGQLASPEDMEARRRSNGRGAHIS